MTERVPMRVLLLAAIVASITCSKSHPPEPAGPALTLDVSKPASTEPIVVTVPSGDPLYVTIVGGTAGHRYDITGVITVSPEWQGATPLPSRIFQPVGERWKATVVPGDQLDILVNCLLYTSPSPRDS